MLLIFGKRGMGKSLLATDIGVSKMLNGFEDCIASYELVDRYNSMGYSFSKNYSHLLFSNFSINCSGTFIPERTSYAINPFKLSLYRKDFDTVIIPPYSLVIIDEAQRVFNSHKALQYPSESSAYIEVSRHFNIDFVLVSQRPKLINPNVRELVDTFICCKGVKDVYDIKGNVKYHKISVIEWYDWSDVEMYLNTGNLVNCHKYTHKTSKCLYSNYDTHFMESVHLIGRKNQDFTIQEFPTFANTEDVEKYGDLFGLNVPDGFYKTNNKTIKDDEFDDI